MSLIDFIRGIVRREQPGRALPSLDGPWKPNDALEECEVLTRSIASPDGLALDGDGNIFVGSRNQILRIAWSGATVVHATLNGVVTCLAWSPIHGLVAGVSGSGIAVLGKGSEPLKVLTEVSGGGLKNPSGVAIAGDGAIFVTEGSLTDACENWVWNLMGKRSDGRLLRFDTQGRGDVLAEGLAFPTAPAVRSSDRSVIFAEAWRHRLFCISPAGGRPEIVMDNLPGYAGSLIERAGGGWYLSFFGQRTHLIEFVLNEDAFREEMMATIEPINWIAPQTNPSEHYLQPVQVGGLLSQNIKKPWAPPRSYGMVAALDSEFQCLTTFHSRSNGSNHGTSGLAVKDGGLLVAARGGGTILTIPVSGEMAS